MDTGKQADDRFVMCPVGGAIQMTLLLLFTVTVTCIVCIDFIGI